LLVADADPKRDIFQVTHDEYEQGVLWLKTFFAEIVRSTAQKSSELEVFAEPLIIILIEILDDLEGRANKMAIFFRALLDSLLSEEAFEILDEEAETVVFNLESSVMELANCEEEHEIYFSVFQEIEKMFLFQELEGLNPDLASAKIAEKLEKFSIFKFMTTMKAGPNSQHQGKTPVEHTARAVYEWFQTASTRFSCLLESDDSSDQELNVVIRQFRTELLSAMSHDVGKFLNPKFEGHHKMSWKTIEPTINFILGRLYSDEERIMQTRQSIKFLINSHDLPGNIDATESGKLEGQAKKYHFSWAIETLKNFDLTSEDIRAWAYLQKADMDSIPGMKTEFMVANWAIFLKLVKDLGFSDLADGLKLELSI